MLQEEARLRVCEVARQREEQRWAQEAEEEARRSREMAQRRAANKELHRFRERVRTIVYSDTCLSGHWCAPGVRAKVHVATSFMVSALKS